MRMSFSSQSGASRRVPVSPSIVLFLMAGIFVVIGAIMYLVSNALDKDARLLAAEGQEIEAEVLDRRSVEKVEHDRDNDRNSSFDRTKTTTTYYVTVAYSPNGGNRIETEITVSRGRYEALTSGTTVGLFYAPSKPTLIEFERGEKAADARIFRWVSIGLGLLGMVLAGLGFKLRQSTPATA